jgi:hypothetical protein
VAKGSNLPSYILWRHGFHARQTIQFRISKGPTVVTHVHVTLQSVVVERIAPDGLNPPTNALHMQKLFVMAETWHRLLLGPLSAYSDFSQSLICSQLAVARRTITWKAMQFSKRHYGDSNYLKDAILAGCFKYESHFRRIQ